jgi:tRNA-splicing endonuclease subunit Sen54
MVTGGSSGIGYAIAKRFLAEGAGKIIIVGRSKQRLSDAVRRLRSASESGTTHGQSRDPIEGINMESSAAKQMGDGVAGSRLSDGVGTTGAGQFDLLVGDVGDSSFWSDEVKKSMVRYPYSASLPPRITPTVYFSTLSACPQS